MKINITEATLKDLIIIEINAFNDQRGYFIESWNRKDFLEAGLDLNFVQDNQSGSKKGVVRGLHYQDLTTPVEKLVRCVYGEIFDVAVDLRTKSETFGKWFGIKLSSENKKQLYIPVGFAHGFAAISDYAEVLYKQTGYYNPSAEGTILWNDKDIAIEWPITNPIISEKDQQAKTLEKYLKNPAFT